MSSRSLQPPAALGLCQTPGCSPGGGPTPGEGCLCCRSCQPLCPPPHTARGPGLPPPCQPGPSRHFVPISGPVTAKNGAGGPPEHPSLVASDTGKGAAAAAAPCPCARGHSRGIGASAVPAAPWPPEHVGVGLSSVPESSGWEVGVCGASTVVTVAKEAPLVSPPVSQEGVATVGPCHCSPWGFHAPRAWICWEGTRIKVSALCPCLLLLSRGPTGQLPPPSVTQALLRHCLLLPTGFWGMGWEMLPWRAHVGRVGVACGSWGGWQPHGWVGMPRRIPLHGQQSSLGTGAPCGILAARCQRP